jgi:hypothetical protein
VHLAAFATKRIGDLVKEEFRLPVSISQSGENSPQQCSGIAMMR